MEIIVRPKHENINVQKKGVESFICEHLSVKVCEHLSVKVLHWYIFFMHENAVQTKCFKCVRQIYNNIN